MAQVLMTLGLFFVPLLGLHMLLQFLKSLLLNRTVRMAMAEHPEKLPILLEKLEAANSGWRQDVVGWSAVAMGLGITAGAAFQEESARVLTVQFALTPLFVGVALLLHFRFTRKQP